MSVERQLTVAWQNQPGELANCCEQLSAAGLNIVALATAEAGEYGAMRILVDDVSRAREVFRNAGVAHTTIEVLVVHMNNHSGSLATLARLLSDNKINIEYFYASASPSSESAVGVFKVSDAYRADEILAEAETA